MSATDDHGISAEIDAELDAIVMEQQIPELRDYIKVLRAEVTALREQVSHLVSGQAELTLRRLAIIDETGAERITAHADDFERGAELAVQSGTARMYLWSGPNWGPGTVEEGGSIDDLGHTGDGVVFSVGSFDGDFRVMSDTETYGGRTHVEFESTDGSNFHRVLDVHGLREEQR